MTRFASVCPWPECGAVFERGPDPAAHEAVLLAHLNDAHDGWTVAELTVHAARWTAEQRPLGWLHEPGCGELTRYPDGSLPDEDGPLVCSGCRYEVDPSCAVDVDRA